MIIDCASVIIIVAVAEFQLKQNLKNAHKQTHAVMKLYEKKNAICFHFGVDLVAQPKMKIEKNSMELKLVIIIFLN